MKSLQFPLTGLYFYLTNDCNLKCRHCYINPKFQQNSKSCDFLPTDLFEKIINQAIPLGLKGIKLTGGEPLLHPEFEQLVDFTQQSNLSLTVESNGCLMTPPLANKIARSIRPFISISLDSTNVETHEWLRGVKGSFEAAVQGIRYCTEAGIPTQIIMSLVQRNKNHIDDMIRWAERMGCESVKFNIVQPTERGKKIYQNNENLSVKEHIDIGQSIPRDRQTMTTMRLTSSLPPAFLPLSYMFNKYRHGCGSGCNIKGILGVLWNGDLSICGIGSCVEELRFGNIATSPLKEVWQNNDLLHTLRDGLPEKIEGVCKECVFQMSCSGNCPAHNYYATGRLFSSGWFCQQAAQEELFPKERIKK